MGCDFEIASGLAVGVDGFGCTGRVGIPLGGTARFLDLAMPGMRVVPFLFARGWKGRETTGCMGCGEIGIELIKLGLPASSRIFRSCVSLFGCRFGPKQCEERDRNQQPGQCWIREISMTRVFLHAVINGRVRPKNAPRSWLRFC
jgi:hypothetical protein